MRIVAVIIGAVIAFAIANRLVGVTSAVQGQKTMVLAGVFAAALCPLCYWVAAKVSKG
jgi:hypothetical protein